MSFYRVTVEAGSTNPQDHSWLCRHSGCIISWGCNGAWSFSKDFPTKGEALKGRSELLEIISRAPDVRIDSSRITRIEQAR